MLTEEDEPRLIGPGAAQYMKCLPTKETHDIQHPAVKGVIMDLLNALTVYYKKQDEGRDSTADGCFSLVWLRNESNVYFGKERVGSHLKKQKFLWGNTWINILNNTSFEIKKLGKFVGFFF